MPFKVDFQVATTSESHSVLSNLKVGQGLQLQQPEGSFDLLCTTLDGAVVGTVPGELARSLRHREGIQLHIRTLRKSQDHPGGYIVEVRAAAGTSAPPAGQPNKLSAVEGPPTDDPAGYVVTPTDLERLVHNDEILHKLGDDKLQRLLLHIDGAGNREAALKVALDKPEFRQFADQVLFTMKPQLQDNLDVLRQ